MKIKFKKDQKEFHKAVTLAVDNYFIENHISRKANWFMYFKTFFFLTVIIVCYAGILNNSFSLPVHYLFWTGIGLASVFFAVNCGHDAIHGAYSSHKWINAVMSRSFDVVGANSYMWSITHNIVHHTYTSIDGADEDVESVPFARLTPFQDRKPYQRFQHIYVLCLYCFATISWVFVKDYRKFFQKEIGNYENKNHSAKQYIYLFLFKFLYYTIFLVIPMLIINRPWYHILGGFVLGHLAEGFTIAIIFALAHLVEKASFVKPDDTGFIGANWAVHQMHTTADFGRKSKITSFFTGGLNFQIEHHLFPGICHVHYPAISEIVKKTAEEHGVPYNDYPSFMEAFRSHIRFLKDLGRNDLVGNKQSLSGLTA